MKQRATYGVMVAGGLMGMTAAFLQATEKIQLLQNKEAVLSCDLNSVFSCSNVLNAWQSSVFGFPNSFMCLVLFTIFTMTGLVGLSGGVLPRKLRLAVQALSLFTLGFALWFLAESIYVINALCILCIFCFIGLLLINGSWLRLNASELPIGKRGRDFMNRRIRTGADIFIWISLAMVIGAAMVVRFY